MLDQQSINILQDLLIGVAGNGLTSLIAASGHKVKSLWIAEKAKQAREAAKARTANLLREGLEIVAEMVDDSEIVRFEVVCLFIKSSEVEALVRQIFSAKFLQKSSTIELIREEFLLTFSYFTELPKESLRTSGLRLFNLLIGVCEEVLTEAVENGILAALDAKMGLRHQIMMDELDSIQRNLEFMKGEKVANLPTILEFEREYRKQVEAREGFIRPPFVDATRKYPIDEIYVSPTFNLLDGRNQNTISMANLLNTLHRVVILGNPGGGKSTFTQKLCHDLVAKFDEKLVTNKALTPIRVILRDYGQAKKDQKCSILDFITSTAKSDYQIPPPLGAFEYLLLNGKVVVIFDGLDELLETKYRQEISDDVEAFCSRYPAVPIIVTSRLVGYKEAPLSEHRFCTYFLAPFTENQTKEYIEKWFPLATELPIDQQTKKVLSFLNESRFVPDLRSNPLMLALMCNIYQGENYIPRNRPEVYRRCAEMLFERWDKSRGITSSLPIEAHIRPAMMHLAYWIYTDEGLQGGVTEQALITQATEYLMSKRFEDWDEAALGTWIL